MEEQWNDIQGYEGLYQISNEGRVKSLKYCKEKLLKAKKHNCGYLQVNLYNDGNRKMKLVHRLVAEAFIPNPNGLAEVNHKDENPSNNNVENLEWCGHRYNLNYGTHNERMAQAKSKLVYQYDLDWNLVAIWPSTAECGRNGFKSSAVCRCCNGKLPKYKGYRWSYFQHP